MEQRIGSSSQPLEGAGFDPAFVPGLTSPVSGRAEDVKTKPDDPQDDTADAVDTGPTVPEADEGAGRPEEESIEAAGTAPATADDSKAAEDDSKAAPEGPVFEASDRRARIVADHSGVRLRLDDQECEFSWDEIGAVETATARFGKRYTVTVHTPDRRWYYLEIEADSRKRFDEWEAGLDTVLDEYFDDEAGTSGEQTGPSLKQLGTSSDAPGKSAHPTEGTPKKSSKATTDGTGATAKQELEKPAKKPGATAKKAEENPERTENTSETSSKKSSTVASKEPQKSFKAPEESSKAPEKLKS